MNHAPQWLIDQISFHLSRLMLHHLDFSPTNDDETLVATRDIWVEHFVDKIGANLNQSIDGLRVESAFTRFEKNAKKWPSPAHVSELMPDRPRQRYITQQHEPGKVDLVGMFEKELERLRQEKSGGERRSG